MCEKGVSFALLGRHRCYSSLAVKIHCMLDWMCSALLLRPPEIEQQVPTPGPNCSCSSTLPAREQHPVQRLTAFLPLHVKRASQPVLPAPPASPLGPSAGAARVKHPLHSSLSPSLSVSTSLPPSLPVSLRDGRRREVIHRQAERLQGGREREGERPLRGRGRKREEEGGSGERGVEGGRGTEG